MHPNPYGEGQRWIEQLIERLLAEKGLALDGPIKWTPNADQSEFSLEVQMAGNTKHHRIKYADVENILSKPEIEQELERYFTTYWIPDKSS
jgi:hypothetical protein